MNFQKQVKEFNIPEDIEAEIILKHYAREYNYEQLLKICANSGTSVILREVCQNIWPLKLAYDLGDKDPNKFLIDSLENNRPIYVMILLKEYDVDPSMDDNYTIRLSSANGYLEIVKLLLNDDRIDSFDMDNFAIKWASANEHLEVVKLLLEHGADPSAGDNFAIRMASINGHLEVVKLLLEDDRVDPSTQNNKDIKMASINGHLEIVKLLLQDERVSSSLSQKDLLKYSEQVK